MSMISRGYSWCETLPHGATRDQSGHDRDRI